MQAVGDGDQGRGRGGVADHQAQLVLGTGGEDRGFGAGKQALVGRFEGAVPGFFFAFFFSALFRFFFELSIFFTSFTALVGVSPARSSSLRISFSFAGSLILHQ